MSNQDASMPRGATRAALCRRAFLAGAAALGCTHLLAASYPSRPIRLIVSSAAGSSPDAIARLIVTEMAQQLHQPFVVDNRPGASTVIGTNAVAKADPDGYLLGYATPSLVLNPALHTALPYDTERDLEPVIQFGSQPLVLVVSAASAYANLDQLIEAARRQPDRLTCASTGVGSIFHLAAERFGVDTAARLLHVPYTSGPQAITDLIGGQVDCMFNATNALVSHLRAGRLRALAVTSAARAAVLPEVPTVAERIRQPFDVRSWGGLIAPAQTPRDIVAALNDAANAALAAPALLRTLGEGGYEVAGGTPGSFKAFLRDETARWSEVISRSGLQLR
jgi:tripartite-type tricarboxylate transporter receptor subunit TctC